MSMRTLTPSEAELALTPPSVRFPLRVGLYRMRRKIAGWLKRQRRWEFWPPYVFYPPVVAYVAYLGIRFRSFTLFTATNPAMPASGFVGESKHEILENLKAAAAYLPHSTLLPKGGPQVRLQAALAFMDENTLSFPVVLKPDAGQRGFGVSVVRSLSQMRRYLERATHPIIVQEYVGGKEFGLFYVRRPGKACGRIFSITEKQMPVVIGDGRRTLEQLILDDDRAVCMADFYLEKNANGRNKVVPSGEKVQLVELGTHCRGAIFLDGSYAVTPALEQAIDTIVRAFDGFYFGRFDIRVPSLDDFIAGRNLKVIELNGVTSEATHIYDPKHSLWDAYRTLFRQWRIAFEIGAANRARGARVSSAKELLSAVLDYRRMSQERSR